MCPVCAECGAQFFNRGSCPECGSLETVDLSKKRKWVSRTAALSRAEEGLRCPLCGNDNVIKEGEFYQCHSEASSSWVPGMRNRDPSWRTPAKQGCGYLDELPAFQTRKQSTLGASQ